MRLVAFAFAGVEPELMGIGPIPATKRVLEQTGLTLDDIGLFELNEPFAVQVLTWCDGMGVEPEDERLNPYGGAIACGHPLAATGVRLMAQLAYGFKERPQVRYGLTALCVGMGMGAALVWEAAKPPVRNSGPGEGVRGNREVPPTDAQRARH
jgi:acetyl-CoA acyltransferase